MAQISREKRVALQQRLLELTEPRGIAFPESIAAQIDELFDEVLDEGLMAEPLPLALDETDENQRIVITGMGMVTPFGIGLAPLWSGLSEGRSAIGIISL